jgi:hypothetical protein
MTLYAKQSAQQNMQYYPTWFEQITAFMLSCPFLLRHSITAIGLAIIGFSYFFIDSVFYTAVYEPYFYNQLALFSTAQLSVMQTVWSIVSSNILLWILYAWAGVCLFTGLIITTHIHNRKTIFSTKTIRTIFILTTFAQILHSVLPALTPNTTTMSMVANTGLFLAGIYAILKPNPRQYSWILLAGILYIPLPLQNILPTFAISILYAILTYCVGITTLYLLTREQINVNNK